MTRCEDAAAYVMGALTPAERAAFEEHLPDCAPCRRTVRDLAGLPGLLSRVSPTDLDEPPLPDTLVPGLLRRMRARRHRRLLSGLAAAAAVVALALGGWALVAAQDDPPPVQQVQGQRMDQVVASPVSAMAELHPKPWGTEVVILCTYTAGGYDDPGSYALVVLDREGHEEQVAMWAAVPDREVEVVGSSNLPPSAIAAVEVRTEAGEPLLRLSP